MKISIQNGVVLALWLLITPAFSALDGLRKTYEGALENIEEDYRAERSKNDANYRAALQGILAAAKSKGRLDALIEAKEEL
ncbi:MAG: hypothetical protein AAF492_30350, partial [Verrucomicrobiota bacterium]